MMLLNSRRKKRNTDLSVYVGFIHLTVPLFHLLHSSLLIRYLPVRHTPPFCLHSRAETGSGAGVVRLHTRLVCLATGCHYLTEIYFGRLKTPAPFPVFMLGVAGFVLNLSSPPVPSVDGARKKIYEWVAFVSNGFWKMFFFFKSKSRGKI